MHGYPVYSAFARGRIDPDVVPFLAQLMQSFSGKPVLFSELGNPACPPGTSRRTTVFRCPARPRSIRAIQRARSRV